MNKQLVFIDDSGDPGFKGATSANFVMAAALFVDPDTATKVNEAISDYRRSLGWRDEAEFKFRKTNKKYLKQLLKIVNKYPFEIYAVYLKKADNPKIFRFLDHEKLYNFAVKELLSIMPLNKARVKIDGKYNRQYGLRVKSYIRNELNKGAKKIEDFEPQDSVTDNLIQLADVIVGSINRSFFTEKTDASDYIRIIRKKIVELKRLDLEKD